MTVQMGAVRPESDGHIDNGHDKKNIVRKASHSEAR